MIKKLDLQTINLISAGEVIECPADILKELIENSIDANSKSITVTIKSSGLELIEVKDDGKGISKEDLPVCLERHTTSKLEKIDDIFSLNTFGFRGEALASISSISNFKITSSDNEKGVGYQYKDNQITEIPFNRGTTITIKDLFYNVPVRKKFLKSNTVEFSKIYSVFLEFVILNPEIKFQFISEKKTELFTKTNQEGRYVQVFGKDILFKTTNLAVSNAVFKLTGLLCKPSTYFFYPNNFLYINNRAVYSAQINKIITDSYKDYLMIQQKPFFILFFEVDSKFLDVNIHPKKRTVKIQNEYLFYTQLKEELKTIFSSQPLIKNTPLNQFITNNSDTEINQSVNSPVYSSDKSFLKENLLKENVTPNYQATIQPQQAFELLLDGLKIKSILGQILNTFIVCETENGMILIDQHAAEERINLERNRLEFIEYVKVQNLLTPKKLDNLDDKTKDFISEKKDLLTSLGFNVEQIKNEYYLTTIPEFLNHYFDSDFFYEIIKYINQDPKENLEKIKDKILKLKSCKESIKANDSLTIAQMIELIRKLEKCKDKTICAHGRPTFLVYDKKELEKIFKRIV